MINSVISCHVLSAFRYTHSDFYGQLSKLFDFVTVDDIVYFKRKKVSISSIRDFVFDLLGCWSYLLRSNLLNDAWVVREIIDTVILTLK